MVYKINNHTVRIPDEEIEKSMKKLDITKDEAVELWLNDNGYTVNEEQVILNEKAKDLRIPRDVISENKNKTDRKPRTVKISDEKKQLFSNIFSSVLEFGGNNVTILKENKLIEVKIGEKTFKVDIIENRIKKN